MNKKSRSKKTSNTCLAVIRDFKIKGKRRGELVFAADRRISWGVHHSQIGVRPKVIKRNGVILAGCGLSYLCDLVCELTPIPDKGKMDGFQFVHDVLVPEVRHVLMTKGFGTKDGNLDLPDEFSSVILVGIDKQLFEMSIDASTGVVIDAIDAPYAHGCGGSYALGSLKTTESLNMDVESRLQVALSIAAELSPGCDNNIDIVRESDKDFGEI